jgi:hypothetical protein
LGLGQSFGPPTSHHMANYHGPPPPLPQVLLHHGPKHRTLPKVHLGPLNHGLPPPPPPHHIPQQPQALASEISEKIYGNDLLWSEQNPDLAKIISLDVKCEKQGMKVFLQFDKPFYGIVFSKGHYSNSNCVHLPASLGKISAQFEIGIHACGTAGNTENGNYGYESGSGNYFENIIVIQYDPQLQEVWDQVC